MIAINGAAYRNALMKPLKYCMDCLFLARYIANRSTNVILTISDGWKVVNPRLIHDLAPNCSYPSPGIYTVRRNSMEPIYRGFSIVIKN